MSITWMTFFLSIANQMIQFLNGLTSDERKTAFVVDDTFYGRPFDKKVELCSNVYDHASKGAKFKSGFRLLTLGWTDGSTFVPVAFRHTFLSSSLTIVVSRSERPILFIIVRNVALSKKTFF